MLCLARLWGNFCNYRMLTHYGEPHCRLSRDQSILDLPEREPSPLGNVVSRILFEYPTCLRARLDKLFTDDMVYKVDWHPFVASLRNEWKESLCLTLGLLMFVSRHVAYCIRLPRLLLDQTFLSFPTRKYGKSRWLPLRCAQQVRWCQSFSGTSISTLKLWSQR